jgi:formylglycine-generating enzyme required for sulfatase activity
MSVTTLNYQVATTDDNGQIIKTEAKSNKCFVEDLGNGISLEMMQIPAGVFTMGSPVTEANRQEPEGPQHQVSVPAFWMGMAAVTQAQYEALIGTNPAEFKGSNRPVEQVNWQDAVTFCQKLSQKTGCSYRLPSEAEWEYACRAGTTTPFHFGPTITPDLVNYNGDCPYGAAPKGVNRKQTTPVGACGYANNFGLYDMHGNVWEWCADPWHDKYGDAPSDGSVWNFGGDTNVSLLRGGSWYHSAYGCRAASRSRIDPGFKYSHGGFRVVCVLQ